MKNKAKVSVVIATHNNVGDVSKCIDSIWSREFSDVEVIVVDVNSTDGTRDLFARLASSDEQILFLTDERGSVGHAKNMGIDHARAPYVLIVEPEDELCRNALEYMSCRLDESPEADMVCCGVDSFRDGSCKKNTEERERILSDANRRDSRRREMDSRLMRSWMFDHFAMYRRSFLIENGIRHYEEPGYGRQDDAFRFLAMVKGVPTMSDDPVIARGVDMRMPEMIDARTPMDVCDEFRYLESSLKEDQSLWWKYRLVFWQAYYDRNRLFYEGLAGDLRTVLAKRMQADIQNAIDHKEYSADHFDIQVRNEMKLLLQSTDKYERYMEQRITKRDAAVPEDFVEADGFGQIAKEAAEHIRQMRKKNRLDKAWLMDEMARDLAPLRMLLGLSAEEMGAILGISGSAYKRLETGKTGVSWDQYMALLFVFHFNERTASVTESLGLYPEALKKRITEGFIYSYG